MMKRLPPGLCASLSCGKCGFGSAKTHVFRPSDEMFYCCGCGSPNWCGLVVKKRGASTRGDTAAQRKDEDQNRGQ